MSTQTRMMKFRDGCSETQCGKSECGKRVSDYDKKRGNYWFMDMNELYHSRKVCAAKLLFSGETCEICATMTPKMQIMHHECPEKEEKRYRKPSE